MPIIGAHASAAVSLERSFYKALEIGASCTQIFVSPPRQWTHTNHSEQEVSDYLKKQKETGIKPNFIHGTYLINHPELKHLPFILETPGFANSGPDSENISTLKSLIKQPGESGYKGN